MMVSEKYKVLTHNYPKDTEPPHRQPLEYQQNSEPKEMEVTCEVCDDTIPIFVEIANGVEDSSFLKYFIGPNFLISVILGVVSAYLTQSTVVGVGVAVVVFSLIALITGEKDPIKIAKEYDNNLDKTGIQKKHSIEQMTPEEAEKWGIDPYKTI